MNGWEEHVADYLRLRRQLGALLAWDEHLLGQYTTHLASAGSLTITTANAVSLSEASFSGTGHRIARTSRRLMAVRGSPPIYTRWTLPMRPHPKGSSLTRFTVRHRISIPMPRHPR